MNAQRNAFVEHFKLVFFVAAPQGLIRVEVTPKAMIQCFDAEMTSQSFLDIYRRHQDFLHSVAMSKTASADNLIVLDTESLDASTLRQQQREALTAPITLRLTARAGKSYDGVAPPPAAQDTRSAVRIGV